MMARVLERLPEWVNADVQPLMANLRYVKDVLTLPRGRA